MTLTLVVAVCLFGSLLSVLASAGYLLLPDRLQARTLKGLVSFATGMLLGTAFLHLVPHAIESTPDGHVDGVMAALLGAICAFFLLEKGLIWRHHHCHSLHEHGPHEAGAHHHHPDPHDKQHQGALILVGDSVHNFVDGILIGAAFITDPHLGMVTAVAAITHEIPQELGDFAILIDSGMSRWRAFLFNGVTSLTMVTGAILAWYSMQSASFLLPYFLAFAAASFIYIAVADLMPTLNRRVGGYEALSQFVLIGSGIALTAVIASYHG